MYVISQNVARGGFFVGLIAAVLTQHFTGVTGQYTISGLMILWVMSSTWYYLAKKEGGEEQQQHQQQEGRGDDGSNGYPGADPLLALIEDETRPSARRHRGQGGHRRRLYFLDNLKTFLTCCVILHHQTCAFVGEGWYFQFGRYDNFFRTWGLGVLVTNQCYFMSMFFFISAYFTPSSLEKKGRTRFLRDKFKRLGIPYIFFSFVCSPLLALQVRLFAYGDLSWVTAEAMLPNPGPLWFVGWLLLFNYVYSLSDHASDLVRPLPSAPQWCLTIVGLNLANLACIILLGLSTLAFMPINFGSLPFYCYFFYAGCAAKQNGWFENDRGLTALTKNLRLAVYIAFVVVALSYPTVADVVTLTGGLGFIDLAKSGIGFACFFAFSTLLVCFVFPVMLDFFGSHFDWVTPLSATLAETSYASYIIHPFVVVLFTGIFKIVYNSQAEDEYKILYYEGSITSDSKLQNDQLWLFVGWGLTCASSICITFFVAFLIRKIPGAKQIL